MAKWAWQVAFPQVGLSGIPSHMLFEDSQVTLLVKNLPTNSGDIRDAGLLPGLGRSPGEVNGNPLQHSCLEESMVRGAWQATIHRVSKTQTWLNLRSQHNMLFLWCQINTPPPKRRAYVPSPEEKEIHVPRKNFLNQGFSTSREAELSRGIAVCHNCVLFIDI